MMDFLAQNGRYLAAFLIVGAIVLLVGFLATRRIFFVWRIRHTPRTPIEVFRKHDPQIQPSEPIRPRLTFLGRRAVIWAVVLGILGAGLSYAMLHVFAVDDRYARESQLTTATVVRAPTSPQDHSLRYEFQVNGQTYQGRAEVPQLRYRGSARTSSELDVRYLASDPTVNRPAVEKNFPISVGLIWPGILDFSFLYVLWYLRRTFVLAKLGRLTTGIVVGILPNQYGPFVYYDFQNDHGEVVRGTSWLPTTYAQKAGIYGWKTGLGSAIPVLYLSGNPRLNALQGSMRWQG
jgi:hypothetical protein